MFNTIKKIVPISIKAYYWRYLKRKQKAAKKRIKFDNKTPKEIFTFIYNTNHWSGQESISGGGSNLQHTQEVIKSINLLIKEMGVKSVLDLPCGDFAWMQYVELANVNYVGGDIVDELIQNNIDKYQNKPKVTFKIIDLIKDEIPDSDLLINRDCLVHLSFKDIFKAMDNIKKSNCNYLLTTTFPNHKVNLDITTGDWRTLNLEEPPFNFPKPICIINEQYKHTEYNDKSLALWVISDL